MAAPLSLSIGSILRRGLPCGLTRLHQSQQVYHNVRQISVLTSPLSRPELMPSTCIRSSNTGSKLSTGCIPQGSLLQASLPFYNSTRTAVRFSLRRGRPKTVKQVTYRFFRLHSGIWIRTYAGRKKRLWKRNEETKQRFKYHIFCNKTQSKMLDKMVTNYWKKERHYIDDPYAPYHRRHGIDQYFANQRVPGRPRWYP